MSATTTVKKKGRWKSSNRSNFYSVHAGLFLFGVPIAMEHLYAKRPFGGPEQVLSYLGRYTHRVAIANHRLIKLEDGHVYFRWKDYKQQGKQKVMKLTAEEFIRRFLMHILPAGFCKIRYSGFLSTRGRKERIKRIRRLLRCKAIQVEKWRWQEWFYQVTGILPGHCPECKDELLVTLKVFQPAREPPYQYKVRAIALQ